MSRLKLLALVSLFLLSASDLYSQNRILVCAPADNTEGPRLRDQLAQLATDHQVELVTALPELEGVDAVFALSGFGEPIPLDEQTKYVSFLETGGKLYIRHSDRDHSGQAVEEPLWDRVRDTNLVWMMTATPSTGAYGIKGTFTEGFSVLNPDYDPLRQDVGSLGRSIGLLPVLRYSGHFASETAWTSVDTSLKFVLDFPQSPYYVDAFVAFVACNYFQLCQLDVTAKEVGKSELRYLPLTSEIILPTAGKITISDLVGRTVLSTASPSDRFNLPADLTKGMYIVNWTSGDHQASIVIQR